MDATTWLSRIGVRDCAAAMVQGKQLETFAKLYDACVTRREGGAEQVAEDAEDGYSPVLLRSPQLANVGINGLNEKWANEYALYAF